MITVFLQIKSHWVKKEEQDPIPEGEAKSQTRVKKEEKDPIPEGEVKTRTRAIQEVFVSQVLFLKIMDSSCPNVSWQGLVSIGKAAPESVHKDFHRGNIKFRIGYECVQRVKVLSPGIDVPTVDVTCKIFMSSDSRALFSCSYKIPGRDPIPPFIDSNATSATRQCLASLGQTKKKRSGIDFFGLKREEVIRAIEESPESEDGVDFTGCESPAIRETLPNLHKKAVVSWVGVRDFGRPLVDERYERVLDKKTKYRLHVGYTAVRMVTPDKMDPVYVFCRILEGQDGPLYRCSTESHELDEDVDPPFHKITQAVRHILERLQVQVKHHYSGQEFFGFNYSYVLEKLRCPLAEYRQLEKEDFANYPELQRLLNIKVRGGGETGGLSSNRSKRQRNNAIHDAVVFGSFGDVKSYVSHLCVNHPEIVEEGIYEAEQFLTGLVGKLKISPPKKVISCKETAELLSGKCGLSQRGYKALKAILHKQQIQIPDYMAVSTYLKSVEVGIVGKTNCTCEGCMGASTNVVETLELILAHKSHLEFLPPDKQVPLFEHLKAHDSELYANLDSTKRTLFLRQTGDNFRAAAKMPTEQISFSVLNDRDLIYSPYGQYINCLWRGAESRSQLLTHVTFIFKDLERIARNGVDLNVNGSTEHFNVIIFFVADIGLLEKILGKCMSTSTYGCFWCDLPKKMWVKKGKGAQQTIGNMVKLGNKAQKTIGDNPDHNSPEFKKFQQAHLGQYAAPMLQAFSIWTMCPCGLHAILAHHRYLWKFLFSVIQIRGQESLIPDALRTTQCPYLAYQYEGYLKSKGKHFDGSGKLKMIGDDCKKLEDNIDKFLVCFLRIDKNEEWRSLTFEKMRQVSVLYTTFKGLSRDLRTTSYDAERVGTFKNRADAFHLKLQTWASSQCSEGLPYLHILVQHISEYMEIWGKYLGWGYGFFSGAAGEHLNKRIKFMEVDETNMDIHRFETIIRNHRIKQFHYPDSYTSGPVTVVCSVCQTKGHNKKNKSCPMHPSQPSQLIFEDSDTENSSDTE